MARAENVQLAVVRAVVENRGREGLRRKGKRSGRWLVMMGEGFCCSLARSLAEAVCRQLLVLV